MLFFFEYQSVYFIQTNGGGNKIQRPLVYQLSVAGFPQHHKQPEA